jgi:hypothetical protein
MNASWLARGCVVRKRLRVSGIAAQGLTATAFRQIDHGGSTGAARVPGRSRAFADAPKCSAWPRRRVVGEANFDALFADFLPRLFSWFGTDVEFCSCWRSFHSTGTMCASAVANANLAASPRIMEVRLGKEQNGPPFFRGSRSADDDLETQSTPRNSVGRSCWQNSAGSCRQRATPGVEKPGKGRAHACGQGASLSHQPIRLNIGSPTSAATWRPGVTLNGLIRSPNEPAL